LEKRKGDGGRGLGEAPTPISKEEYIEKRWCSSWASIKLWRSFSEAPVREGAPIMV
jgi:hypothetical protein